MKVQIINSNELRGILEKSRMSTDIRHSGWRVEVYSKENEISVLLTGNGGDFECAQLASAFHSTYSHLFTPNYKVNFYRVPTAVDRG